MSDICGVKQSDGGAIEEYGLQPGDIAFRPPDRKLWSDLSGGRFIQILQSRETYNNLIAELVRGGTFHLDPQDAFSDPLMSQMALTVAHEIDGRVRRPSPRRRTECGTGGAGHTAVCRAISDDA
jgi:hypothetical protein